MPQLHGHRNRRLTFWGNDLTWAKNKKSGQSKGQPWSNKVPLVLFRILSRSLWQFTCDAQPQQLRNQEGNGQRNDFILCLRNMLTPNHLELILFPISHCLLEAPMLGHFVDPGNPCEGSRGNCEAQRRRNRLLQGAPRIHRSKAGHVPQQNAPGMRIQLDVLPRIASSNLPCLDKNTTWPEKTTTNRKIMTFTKFSNSFNAQAATSFPRGPGAVIATAGTRNSLRVTRTHAAPKATGALPRPQNSTPAPAAEVQTRAWLAEGLGFRV